MTEHARAEATEQRASERKLAETVVPGAVSLLRLQALAGNAAVSRVLARPSRPARPVLLQRHASFEHRLLGDARPSDLAAVASNLDPQWRRHLLQQERDRLRIWQANPDRVTREQVAQTWPDARVLTLRNGIVLTYGELNTLGDYLPNPEAIESRPRNEVVSILQTVRQQEFNRIIDLLGETVTISTPEGPPIEMPAHEAFQGAVGPAGAKGTLASISEVQALNTLTEGQGTNQYQSLVSRNACHFAPFSWSRWREQHMQARTLATQGHASNNQELIRQAWIVNGYADHFLQDSFAAGHLINKTLIMQWFVEWVTQHNAESRWKRLWTANRSMWNIDLEHWDQIRTMTAAQQPGLAGRNLYHSRTRAPGESADPQTAEEQATQQQRMDTAGVRASGGVSQEQAYQNYLAFMNSAAVQAASGAVHDWFNERSLMVGSPAHKTAFRIWGDETLVTSGEGVQIAAETAHMSQQAIDDIARTGQSAVSADQIQDRFPDRVQPEGSTDMVPLENWNDSLHKLCWETIFPDVHYRIIDTLKPQMGKVSVDQGTAPAPAAGSLPQQPAPPQATDAGVLPGGVGNDASDRPDAGVPVGAGEE